ncbi:conserved hypothetical protein [Bacillus sp. 349Y]|nr:conserved hypothetical protein [Bacillus sp. 349Y]
MQKNYRDFTVGELLELGFDVYASKHEISSKEEAIKELRIFESTKQSTNKFENAKWARTWNGNFEAAVFYEKE